MGVCPLCKGFRGLKDGMKELRGSLKDKEGEEEKEEEIKRNKETVKREGRYGGGSRGRKRRPRRRGGVKG